MTSALIVRRLVAIVFVTAALAGAAAAQELTAPLPLDPTITTGRLANGLVYFIRQNPRPGNRVLMRLAVRAGSNDEADDQRGLAHMLEHMAFNGSAKFKPGELVKYLESIGARFGPHVNAYTSYDETVYMLDVPTDRPGAVRRGFEALSDFAAGITMDPVEVNKERGVVIEEWRGRLGAGTRMQQPQIEGIFGPMSRYAQRLPIGTPESLKAFTVQRLRDFYRTSYRGNRMAVVVVGDIAPADIERLIRELFAAVPGGTGARPAYPIPPHTDTRFVTTSDPEAQGSSVSIIHKRPFRALISIADYRHSLVGGLMAQMVNARLGEMARQPGAPFLGASVGDQTLGLTVQALSVSARVNDGRIPEGLSAIAQEVARIKQFGFGAAEFDRAQRSTLAQYERMYNERNNGQSGALAAELLRHYLSQEAVPGIERELPLARELLQGITREEVAAYAREVLPDTNRVVLASAPQKAGLTPVSDVQLKAALTSGLAATVTAWRDEASSKELMSRPAQPGTVRARREMPEIGVTVLTLSNGVEVWLKPTEFRNDQIIYTSYARGGVSLAPEADYLNASLASSFVSLGGVGGFTPVDLGKMLAGRLSSAGTYISTYLHGITGSSTPKDLETSLQLAYLNVMAPNNDPSTLELMKRRMEANLANQSQSPGVVFGERLRSVNTVGHYTSRPIRLDDLPKLDAKKMLDFYTARFANAANFTFFFVGSFKVDDVAPLIAAYLGALPSTGKPDSLHRDLGLGFPASVVREVVRKGQEPRANTVITFFSDPGLDEAESHRAESVAEVLQTRLREVLREQLGGTYSVGVGYSNTAPQTGYGTTQIQFGSSPENVDKLVAAVLDEVDKLRRDGPTASEVNNVKQAEKNDLAAAVTQNGFWLNSLQSAHVMGRDPRMIPRQVERTDALTEQNIHAAAQKYLPAARYTVLSLLPESTASSTTK
jgi:zinc protease